MPRDKNNVLLVSMPFAETSIPSIQLALLQSYLTNRDIEIETLHLYLKAADFYGLKNYNYHINPPNDSYIAQMAFSKYLFPDNWKKNIRKFEYFYNEIMGYDKGITQDFTFEKYIGLTDEFYNWTVSKINWDRFDIIGFTLNYGQFLSTLAVAKKIKELFPEKKIIFGGSTTINELGKRVLKTFYFVDYIISGDGEESLFLLASNTSNEQIPGLIYRKDKEVFWNKNNNLIDLNNLPFLNFESYYSNLSNVSDDIKQYYSLYGRLPIELSRGCWWNNCTFCNIHAYHKKYREKNYERFIEELTFLSDTFNMLEFQVIGCTLPQKNYKQLCEKITELNRDYIFYIESRAGQLKLEEYTLLKNAGFTNIQTGIEAFSSNYLKKINKGVRLIDNIAALKFCKENNIKNSYNLIIDYPNEENKDFKETEQNIRLFKQYLDPPQISKFVVGYGSKIYENPEKFNIEKIEHKIIDTIMYPPEILANNFCFFYSFKRKEESEENNWNKLVTDWKNDFETRAISGVKRNTTVDKLIFYYVDGGCFVKIYDKRFNNQVKIYVLDKNEREVFLSCKNVVSLKKIISELNNISEKRIREILKSFIQIGIVFKEEEWYLSLPLEYNCVFKNTNKMKYTEKLQTQAIV